MFFHRRASSSQSPSAAYKVKNNNGSASDFAKNRGQSFTEKRLTRMRKLRHVSGRELGLDLPESSFYSSLSSPDSTRKPRSPNVFEHWSFSAIPQPLPLPEGSSVRRHESTGSNSGQSHLGSPKEGSSGTGRKNIDNVAAITPKPMGNGRRRFFQDVNSRDANFDLRLNIPERSNLTSGFVSPAVSPQRPNARDISPSWVATNSVKSSTNNPRRFSQDSKFEGINHKLKVNAPAKSAPASAFSSPAVSPRRSDSGDLFPSSMAFHEFQNSLVACPLKLSPVKTVHSSDQSPLHSPTAQGLHLNPRSPSGTAFPSHHMDWPESNSHCNAHPLPLPPKAILQSMPSQSTTTHHIKELPCVSSFKGQWQKGKLIGSGAFGSVYIATNRETGALCAMKEVSLIPDDPKSAECVKQLEQEIKVLRDLKHQNIVQYYGSEIVDDHFYIYLEYVHPGSIDKYVREHCGYITESIVRNFTRHILSGLAYLHSTKTMHRDIKGANLLVDASGVVKLADFGLSKHLVGESYNLSLKGSPYWMAPEVMQAAMKNNANPDLALAVDIWSLGCTVIEMLNGKPPWSELTGTQAMFKVLNGTPPIPETLSSVGRDFLCRCFQRNPANRPTALKLLDHPFVRNSHDQIPPPCAQSFSALNLMDRVHVLGDGTKHKADPTSVSPGTRIMNGNLQCSGGNCQHYNAKTSYCTEASHHPSCSMHKVRPSLSATQLIQSSHSFTPFSNSSSNTPLVAGNNHPCVLRTHGMEVPHL